MNEYEIREKEGRRMAVADFGHLYEIYSSENTYSRDDMIFAGDKETLLVEVKNIHRPYRKFGNFQIDYEKIEALYDRANKKGYVPTLLCYFDDYRIMWRIDDLSIYTNRIADVRCTATTATNYGENKRDKRETYFYIDEAFDVKDLAMEKKQIETVRYLMEKINKNKK